jgi:hypothetical protein
MLDLSNEIIFSVDLVILLMDCCVYLVLLLMDCLNTYFNQHTVAGGGLLPDIPEIVGLGIKGGCMVTMTLAAWFGMRVLKKAPKPAPVIQLAVVMVRWRNGRYIPAVVDLNDPTGYWLKWLYFGKIYGYFIKVTIRCQGFVYTGLVQLPNEDYHGYLSPQEILELRNRGATADTVFAHLIESPDRDTWFDLEDTYDLRVFTGFGTCMVELRADNIHPDLLEVNDWDHIIVDGTGFIIMLDADFNEPI